MPPKGKISFQVLINGFQLKNRRKISDWISNAILQEKKTPGDIAIVCCSDEYLLSVNKEYLRHDYYTDIITFQYSDSQHVSGDLLISIDRIRENASDLNIPATDELHRVIIHGILHLCGYKDKKRPDKELMTKKENYYLKKRIF